MARKKNTEVLEEKKTKKTKASLKKEEEIKEELRDEVKEEVKEEIVDDVKEEILDGGSIMPKRKVSFWAEVKALFIILVIIGLISLGGWYWYTHMSPRKSDPIIKQGEAEKLGYNYSVYSSKNKMEVKYGKYIVDAKDNVLYRLMDLNGNVLFEGEQDYSYIYLDINNNLYVVKDEDAENENVVSLYKLEESNLVKVIEMYEEEIYLSPIVYVDKEDNEYLLGFAGLEYTNMEDRSTVIYSLEGKKAELEGYNLLGDTEITGAGQEFITHNKKYISFGSEKEGLYNLDTQEVAIPATYDHIYATYNNSFVVVKNGKAGIINEKQKKLTSLEYDFIDINNGFYVVAKNKKLAIMDNNYKMVTDFVFAYQGGTYNYKLCCMETNSFVAFKRGSKYLLITNQETTDVTFAKNEAYLISSDGKYETIKEDGYELLDDDIYLLQKDENKVKFYDKALNYKFDIDLTSYDFDLDDIYFEKAGNTLFIPEKDIYYNYTSGEELEKKEIIYENMNVRLEYLDKKINVKVDDKDVHTLVVDSQYPEIEYIDKGFYIVGANEVMLFKEK